VSRSRCRRARGTLLVGSADLVGSSRAPHNDRAREAPDLCAGPGLALRGRGSWQQRLSGSRRDHVRRVARRISRARGPCLYTAVSRMACNISTPGRRRWPAQFPKG
jgi:hypothetical protein